LGWVGGDRTLKHDIRVIPGGQCWIWQQGNTKPKQKAYFPPFLLAHQRQKAFRKSDIKQPHDSFIRHEVLVLTKFYLQRFVEEAIDECIAPQDVPDVFYMYDRVRRLAGTNARKGISTGDRFSLLCTRSFVKGAFTIPALHRYSESLHYAHKSPHLSYTPFQLNQEIDIRDVNVLALDVAKTSHERS
jgi:hypothetical protein